MVEFQPRQDGKSVGTLLNVFRLLTHRKIAVVYVTPEKQFCDLRSLNDWKKFIERYDASLRRKVEEKAASETPADEKTQAELAF